MTGRIRKTARTARTVLRGTRQARKARRDVLLAAHLPWIGVPLAALHLAWWYRRRRRNRQREGT